ncbi:F-box protein At3g07870 [Andrographis paniculata]|uniref:F-box protein At3g07870 n=1 Tax=Andrographis paniculata TaxID=175694 RepID=UPI0021E78830|nr:F-box protein At3g07870 [Andrographis paniculata]
MDSQINKPIPSDTISNTNSINPFNQIPIETIIEILSRLPIKSLIQFTFTCKTLNPLSTDPHLITLHLSRSDESYIIIHSNRPFKNQLYFLNFSDQKVCKFEIPFALFNSDFNIIASSNGLLCLIDPFFPTHVSLYNPFTGGYAELPPKIDFHETIIIHGYGFDPISHDYKVVQIVYDKDLYSPYAIRENQGSIESFSSNVDVYSLRSNVWMNKGVAPYLLEKWSSPGVLVNHKLHWVSIWGRNPTGRVIVSYNLVDDTFTEIAFPSFESFSRRIKSQLLALNGCLCASMPRSSGCWTFDIWVMREYGVNESWVKEYSIGIYYPNLTISNNSERLPNMSAKKIVKVLCALKSGELVMQYRRDGLVLYDPRSKRFKELEYKGMPKINQAIVHVGSLVSPHLG